MAYNPNAVYLSPSRISDFKSCQQSFYYRYIYKSPKTGLKIQVINPKLALGAIVHDTLNQFVYGFGVDKTYEELLRIFEHFWSQSSGDKGGFSTVDEERGYKDRGLRMLERFWGNEHFRTTETVKLPSFTSIELEDDLVIVGRLDWLEKADNFYHIIDFKTGENEERSDSIQLPLYAVLASGILKSKDIKASYWYLDKDEPIKEYALPDINDTLQEIKRIGYIMKNAINTKSFRCNSRYETCWACRDYVAVANGKGKLVHVDFNNRKQEVYVMAEPEDEKSVDLEEMTDTEDDLPF